ncbi:phytoene/squalene synthase family protein [Caldiplasma sukawensis]
MSRKSQYSKDFARMCDRIFRKGSKTYYNSSKLFPASIREEVSTLYAFVRVADDLVDAVPQKVKEFMNFRKSIEDELTGKDSKNPIIKNMVKLAKDKKFEITWIIKFLDSMEMDIYKKKYDTINETIDYMYGSAEVIGLMMSKIMGLDFRAFPSARMLGRTMQYINFIRDILEDISLGRQYIPTNDLNEFGLENLTVEEINKKRENFIELMKFQISRYEEWDRYAREGFKYIPSRLLIPIKTATDMYLWTARKIEKDPMVVLERKVKPSKLRIMMTGMMNTFYCPLYRIKVRLIDVREDYNEINIITEFEKAKKELKL